MQLVARIGTGLLAQRGYLFPWAPVFLSLGIGVYFALRQEPDMGALCGLGLAAGLGAGAALRWPGAFSPLLWALALMGFGFVLAAERAHRVGGPVLGFRYYGPVEGRVVALDRSASDALRVTLDRVRMGDLSPEKVPRRVRLSLHGPEARLVPGERVMTTAHLSPPQGPVEPGGFDFRRYAWFKSIGAVGYTRVPVLTAAIPEGGLRVFSLRISASERIRSILPGDVGGFAAAVTTGDRSGVGQAALEALRASNLAHLLAISGLHMGLLTGFVFAALRIGFSLFPTLALRLPVRKLAAVGALIVAAGYLALSGGNIATERAFVMVSVMLCAVLVDRRAISMRAVAVAALVVLVLRPEALLSPGFQMSFAATTALVAVFGAMRDAEWRVSHGWRGAVFGLVISSAVAGLATAPIGAAHFNTLSHFGLFANLLSVPLMGSMVIPAAVLAAVLAPIGFDWIGLEIMGLGLRWILGVADVVAGLDGAQSHVVAPDAWILPVLALGALWVMLWRGRLRWIGLAPVVAALTLWPQAERPSVLIAENGALVGVMTEEGRALSKARGSGFVAGVWLENDGDTADQPRAAARWPMIDDGIAKITVAGMEIVHVQGKRAARGLTHCKRGQLVVASIPLSLGGDCDVLDPNALDGRGSFALVDKGWVTARAQGGTRLWSPREKRDQ
ncbi:ComEC/Rec2 family competence protein [Lutimaribacter marinistellae]|uniref:ComEC/Rec2 family competence protein n=1 Tax=Lutimaribacter marinistellae TaxID=1820329 RepID=A0ABV7TMV2_9RHOB